MKQLFEGNEKRIGFVYERETQPSYCYFKYSDSKGFSLQYLRKREEKDIKLSNTVARLINESGIKYNLKNGIGWEFGEKEIIEFVKKANQILIGKIKKVEKKDNIKSKKLAEATYRFQNVEEN